MISEEYLGRQINNFYVRRSLIKRVDYNITKDTLDISLKNEAKTFKFKVDLKKVKHPLPLF